MSARFGAAVRSARVAIAYTDGACSGNPGPGAWAYRLEWPDGTIEEDAGAEPRTTNNREELKAIGAALGAFRARAGDDPTWRIVVRTDSTGAINWLTRKWKRNANLDLFPALDAVIDARVRFEYVRGHSGDPGNERVDSLAVAATRGLMGEQVESIAARGRSGGGVPVYAVLRHEGGTGGTVSVHAVVPTHEDAEREVQRLNRATRSGSLYEQVQSRYYPAGR